MAFTAPDDAVDFDHDEGPFEKRGQGLRGGRMIAKALLEMRHN
ncbi:MAG TPA: hypothetical protein PLD80_05495 [Rugosibacter sp.]|nr:hypothetical protein [Rugosibacter sp.]